MLAFHFFHKLTEKCGIWLWGEGEPRSRTRFGGRWGVAELSGLKEAGLALYFAEGSDTRSGPGGSERPDPLQTLHRGLPAFSCHGDREFWTTAWLICPPSPPPRLGAAPSSPRSAYPQASHPSSAQGSVTPPPPAPSAQA